MKFQARVGVDLSCMYRLRTHKAASQDGSLGVEVSNAGCLALLGLLGSAGSP